MLLCVFVANLNAQDDVQYLEIYPFASGFKYRTSPKGKFKRIGLLGQKLKPYFKDNPSASASLKKYQMGQSLFIVANLTSLTGTGMMVYALREGDGEFLRKGLVTNLVGIGLIFIISEMTSTYLYSAVDSFNYNRRPFGTNSFVPKIQLSNHSLGMGLVWDIE